MIAERCKREDELLDALGRGFVGEELGAHAAGCDACHELHTVAGALLDDHSEELRHASVPASGTMWWRMQMRQRHDAQATARRSLFIGQAVTLTVALILVGTLLGTEVLASIREALGTLGSIQVSTPVLLAAASWLLMFPLAGWVAIRQK